ncbi:LysR family transcriptional regulator [Inquilinus sp. CA228]|uniref:LysR family transcriptional regulator n=1 Tax=Inquilinus sp. CA228 TaxID=3455609 RepID=UPI003F8D53A8
MIDFRSLEMFQAVVETGSATLAAQKVGVTQPAITKSIANLEAQTGLTLFERGRFGMRPTLEGSIFLSTVRRNLIGLDEIKTQIEAIKRGARGLVRISTLPAYGEETIPKIVSKVLGPHPDVKIALNIDNYEGIVRAVSLGHAEVGVLIGPVVCPPELEPIILGQQPLVAVVPDGHPLSVAEQLTVADLATARLILVSSPHPLRALFDQMFLRAGLTPDVRLEARTQRAAASLAISSPAGIALVERHVARNAVPGSSARIVPLADFPVLDIIALVGRGDRRAALLDLVLSALQTGFAPSIEDTEPQR